ncbi:hypothetical protein B0I37DRAFT_447567 [Chaetomium sp. MPI-CAGE-AT-0009]|nr:hypothetical protein B0I37DRAFT_447567 [Chaetomium sp. MPI-CAGE-AT-0009]
MSPRIRSCAICGWIIYDDEGSISWMNQFRGLYSCPEGIVVTGVGLYTDPGRGAFIAPPDPNARFDDPGYDHPDEDEFAVMRRWDINGKRGFIFHDACWSLLQRAFSPTPVPHVRLFEVLDSLPLVMAGDSINWGHDYGGLAIIREDHFFPWEPRFADREFPDGWFGTLYSADPLAVSEVDKILTETSRAPSNDQFRFTGSAAGSGKDPFSSLPMELCSVVAEYLPTSDVLNSRHASRSFWHVFHSEQFWVSRFRGNSDRSWLFEVRDCKTASRDWRWLYHCTADRHIGQGLRNRKRIWALIQHLAPILELHWSELPCEPLPEEPRNWVLVAGSMRDQQPEGFCQLEEGCRRLRSKQAAIPDGISQVSASTIRVGNSEYIAGISLSTPSGEVLRIGYSNGRWRSLQLNGLAGFNLAVGPGGIHALQCIDGRSREPLAWLGCPDDTPKTERLAMGNRITALEVAFDACRMVSVAVAQETDTTREHLQDALRRSAIWYPDVPSPVLGLNEDFFVPLKSYTWGYKPIFWTYFGGAGGMYLPNLTKVTASCWDGSLLRIDFSFDRQVPAECRRFGRVGDSEYGTLVQFPIDGPGGEVIDKVEVCQKHPREDQFTPRWSLEEGSLIWLAISTNRGRICEFGTRSKSRSRRVVTKKVSAAPGTAITGLFGAQYRNLGLGIMMVGVVTEPLRES